MTKNRRPDDKDDKEEKLRKLADLLANNKKLKDLGDEANPPDSAGDDNKVTFGNGKLKSPVSINVSGATSRSGDDYNHPFSDIASPASGAHREVSKREDPAAVPEIQISKKKPGHWDFDAPPTPSESGSASAEVSRAPSQPVSPRYGQQVQSPGPSKLEGDGAASLMSPKGSQLLQVPVATGRALPQGDHHNKAATLKLPGGALNLAASAEVELASKEVTSGVARRSSPLSLLNISAASAATAVPDGTLVNSSSSLNISPPSAPVLAVQPGAAVPGIARVNPSSSLNISAAGGAVSGVIQVDNEKQSGSNLPVGAASAAGLSVNVKPKATQPGAQMVVGSNQASVATAAPRAATTTSASSQVVANKEVDFEKNTTPAQSQQGFMPAPAAPKKNAFMRFFSRCFNTENEGAPKGNNKYKPK